MKKINPRQISDEIKRKYDQKIFYAYRYPNGYLFGFDKSKGIWREVSGEVEMSLRKRLPSNHLSVHTVREIMADLCQSLYREKMPSEPPWNLINFVNGVWDAKEKGFVKCGGNGDDPPFFLSRIPHKFNLDVDRNPTLIDSLFEDWVGSERKVLLYEMVGYTFLRCNLAKKFFILYGPGDNGKSTFASLLRKILGGDNCSALSMDEIMSDRFASSSLLGKMVNISGELVPNLKRTDKLKLLTGGDEIFAQKKFREGFFFTPYTKLIFMGNSIPSTPDSTPAFYLRTLIIPFLNLFPPEKRDTHILDRIEEKEIERVLAKVIMDILPSFIERGFKFSLDPSVDELRRQWDSLSNPFQDFLREHLIPAEEKEFVPNFVLNESYKAFCQKNRLPQLNSKEVAICMRKEGYEPDTRKLSRKEEEKFKEMGFKITSPTHRGWWIHGSQWAGYGLTDVTGDFIFNINSEKNLPGEEKSVTTVGTVTENVTSEEFRATTDERSGIDEDVNVEDSQSLIDETFGEIEKVWHPEISYWMKRSQPYKWWEKRRLDDKIKELALKKDVDGLKEVLREFKLFMFSMRETYRKRDIM